MPSVALVTLARHMVCCYHKAKRGEGEGQACWEEGGGAYPGLLALNNYNSKRHLLAHRDIEALAL